jgi:hypothetical protein
MFFFDYEVDILNLQMQLYLPFEVWKLFAVTRDKEAKSADYNDPPSDYFSAPAFRGFLLESPRKE